MRLSVVVCFLICIFSVGCLNNKKILESKTQNVSFEVLAEKNLLIGEDFEWFHGVVQVSGLSEQNFQLNLRIKKDSIIWGVAKKLGIEVARFQIDEEKIEVLDRFNKVYYYTSWIEIIDFFNIKNIENEYVFVQNLILGRILLYDLVGKKKAIPNERALSFSHEVNNMNFDCTFENGSNHLLMQKIFHNYSKVHISEKLSNYSTQENVPFLFSEQRNLFFQSDTSNHFNLELVFKKIEWNVPKKTPFSVSSRYQKRNLFE